MREEPGLGEKSSQRLALWVLRNDRATVEELARTLLEVKSQVGFCEICANAVML